MTDVDIIFPGWQDTTGNSPLSQMYTDEQQFMIFNLDQALRQGKFGADHAILQYADEIADTIAAVKAEDRRQRSVANIAHFNREFYGPEQPRERRPDILALTNAEKARAANIAATRAGQAAAFARERDALLAKRKPWCGPFGCFRRRGGSRRKTTRRKMKTRSTRRR